MSQISISWGCTNYRKLSYRERTNKILERSRNREYFFSVAVKMLLIAKERGIRLIMENPWNEQTFLKGNFIMKPQLVDTNRMLRGDYFIKPTAYWFINFNPKNGFTFQFDKEQKTVLKCRSANKAGVCSTERSLISSDYARNFICDFIIGKKQPEIDLTLF